MRDFHQKQTRSRRNIASRRLFRGSALTAILLLAVLSCQMPGYNLVLADSAFGSVTRYVAASISRRLSAPAPAPMLSESAIQQMQQLMDEKKSRTPEQQKIASKLVRAMKSRRGETSAALSTLRSTIAVNEKGLTEVDIRLNVAGNRGLVKMISQLGGELEVVVGNHIRAKVPIDNLEDIARDSSVVSIRPPAQMFTHRAEAPAGGIAPKINPMLSSSLRPGFTDRASRVNSMLSKYLSNPAALKSAMKPAGAPMIINTSEGDVTHRAAEARGFFGVNGTGVSIGVLSDGVDSLATLQGSGDLPAGITIIPGQAGAGDEGSAMLEIVHDLAPGASLFFATANGGPANFANNIRLLRMAGCDIIVDDIIYLVESPFQDGQAPAVVSPTNGGAVAQAVRDVTADGALYFSSAGNEGNVNDGTSGTWEGNFLGNGNPVAALAGAGTLHNFGDGGVSNLVTATSAVVTLHWANPLGGADDDYDLYILNNALTTIFDVSDDVQDGNDDPVEITGQSFTNERIVVAQFDGDGAFIRVENFRGELNINTPGATFGHSSVAEAFAVAATPAAEAFGPPPDPVGPFPNPHSTADGTESFTADGPRTLFFNPDSTPIAGGPTIRQKPDIAAADGVSCAAPGFEIFFGTSASAPHAAAIAGLLLSSNPMLTPAQVRTALTSSALDIELAGVDRDSGAGIVMAFQALEAIGAEPVANLELGTVTPTPAVINPGDDVDLSIQLNNIGGANATAVSATLSSTSPDVTINTAVSAYPDITAGSSATNTTPFNFTVSCDTVCGTTLDFTLTVTFTGGTSPAVFDFSLITGADGAPVTASYTGPAVPIPDGSGVLGPIPGAPAVATLNVAGFTGSIRDLNFRIDGSSCNATAGSTTVGIDHTFVSDLIMTLTSPSGTSVVIISEVDLSGNNFCQTLLDDDAGAPSIQGVATADNPFTGTFAPNSPLSAFDGEDPNGNWTLSIVDNFAQDIGNIRAFSLILTPSVCTPSESCDGDGVVDLSVTKTASSQTPVIGQNLTYTITVTNNGTADATNVVVTDNLPASVTFVSCDAPPDGVCGGTGNMRTITYPSIPAGASRTITLVVTVVASGSIVNTASAASTEPDANPEDNTGSTAGVQAFSFCLQDDSSPSKVVLVDQVTGAYQFCCGTTTVTGTGSVTKKGNVVTIIHNLSDRRVQIKVDQAQKKGTATLQTPPGQNTCSISDTNTTNNTCACTAPPAPGGGQKSKKTK